MTGTAGGLADDGGGDNGGTAAGGIDDFGTLTLTDSTLLDDTATGGAGGDGLAGRSGGGGGGGSAAGGIYVEGSGSLTVDASDTFSGNSATGGHGGGGGTGQVINVPDIVLPHAAGGAGGISGQQTDGSPGASGSRGAQGGAPGEAGQDGGRYQVDMEGRLISFAAPGGGGGGNAYADYGGPGAIDDDGIACYCRGTRILTAAGERPVEELSIGDGVVTRSGATQPIRWIGTRSYAGRFLRGRAEILPICIRAGALDVLTPARDLRVSPHHAMYLDGVLVEACDLVNGTSVYRAEAVESVDYFHIELEAHDAVLAEGAWSETFLDEGNRSLFHNAPDDRVFRPAGAADARRFCAPRVTGGERLEALRRRIGERAVALADAAASAAAPPHPRCA